MLFLLRLNKTVGVLAELPLSEDKHAILQGLDTLTSQHRQQFYEAFKVPAAAAKKFDKACPAPEEPPQSTTETKQPKSKRQKVSNKSAAEASSELKSST